MFSDRPSTPGRSMHTDRAQMSTVGPGGGRRVELVDQRRVDEVVELEHDPGGPARGGGGGHGADLLDEPGSHLERSDEQLAELLRAAEAGDVVEDVGDVGRDLLVGREEADVLVQAGRRGVVVAGSDMDVAP